MYVWLFYTRIAHEHAVIAELENSLIAIVRYAPELRHFLRIRDFGTSLANYLMRDGAFDH
jgi:hypothetical protein